MQHVYVYYRVDPGDAAAARAEAAALQAALAPYCGAPPRLVRRCDDAATWMEIYEDLADGATLVAAMRARLEHVALDTLRRCERHVECFSDG